MRLIYKGKILSKEDFVGVEDLPNHFLVDIEALVTPEMDFITVEVVSVRMDPSKREVSAFLKLEVERDLEILMRSMYLAEAHSGHEGGHGWVDDF